MAGPIIIMRPSGNAFDWTVENSPTGMAATPAKADPAQSGNLLHEAAFGPGARLFGQVGDSWQRATSAIASFRGKTLVIERASGAVLLRWTLGGERLAPVTPSFPYGWNAALDKVEPDSIVVVLETTGARELASAVKIELPEPER